MTRVCLGIAEKLSFTIVKCSKLQACPLKGWGELHLWARSTKRGAPSQSSRSKFIGLRMARDSWQMFIGLEMILFFVSHTFMGSQSLISSVLFFWRAHA